MQQFNYVLLAYGTAFVILGISTWMIFKRDRKMRRLIDKIIDG